MEASMPSGHSNLVSPQKSGKFLIGLLTIVLIVIVAASLSSKTRSKEQLRFDNWLSVASVELRHEKNVTSLPVLTMKIIGEDGKNLRELHLMASFDSDSRERVIRILELIREANLFNVRRSEGSAAKPGDVVLEISSPANTFALIVPQQAISGNVKAGLMLKLFDEFSKIPVTTMARMADEAAENGQIKAEQDQKQDLQEDPILNDGILPEDDFIREGKSVK